MKVKPVSDFFETIVPLLALSDRLHESAITLLSILMLIYFCIKVFSCFFSELGKSIDAILHQAQYGETLRIMNKSLN
jgi:hypothetical protein